MTDDVVICPECGAYGRQGIERHGITTGGQPCPLQSRVHLEKMAKQYYDAWLGYEREHRSMCVRLRELAVLWQGKHAMLRHENNKLRRKVRTLEAEAREAMEVAREMGEREP